MLPVRFNAMVSIDPGFAADAAIVHLFSNGRPPRQSVVERLLRAVAQDQEIDWQDIRKALQDDPLIEIAASADPGSIRRYLAAARAWLRTV